MAEPRASIEKNPSSATGVKGHSEVAPFRSDSFWNGIGSDRLGSWMKSIQICMKNESQISKYNLRIQNQFEIPINRQLIDVHKHKLKLNHFYK